MRPTLLSWLRSGPNPVKGRAFSCALGTLGALVINLSLATTLVAMASEPGAIVLGATPTLATELASATQVPFAPNKPPSGASFVGTVPPIIPAPATDGVIYIPDAAGVSQATTLVPRLQNHLSAFLIDARQPIAAVIVVDVKTGNILAMAQGKAPELWGSRTHTALHGGFPAASVFKTVVTATALEVAAWDPLISHELQGGCSRVGETGAWLIDSVSRRSGSDMSLRKAFGSSCNGFYAKIAVNNLGIGAINQYAKKFGWTDHVHADFPMEKSSFHPPNPQTSSAHTVGRFAAGFGNVGLSAAHAASMMLTIAHRGHPMPLRLFQNSARSVASPSPIYSESTADQMLDILDASVLGGTASFAFRRGKYTKLRGLVGGKTGTLTGSSPPGLTTWFAGMAPTDQPEVIVASVVMLEGRWIVKGPSLAAEAFWAYFDQSNMEANQISNISSTVAKHVAPKALMGKTAN